METVGIAQHRLLRLRSCNGDLIPRMCQPTTGNLGVPARLRKLSRRLSVQFSDSAHQQFYVSSKSNTRKKEKEKSSEIKVVKNKLKYFERLSRDLSSFSLVAHGDESENNLTDGPKISEAVEILRVQLQQLKLEEKKEKRRMKEKKAMMKIPMKQSKNRCKSESSSSSSSSSSESSDSECGKVVDMNRLRGNSYLQSENTDYRNLIEEATSSKPSQNAEQVNLPEILEVSNLISQEKNNQGCYSRIEAECSSSLSGFNNEQINNTIASGISSTKRIEICMGGKCKKLGAGDLLEEFQRKVGGEGAVTGCKCMGKCKDGPNLRVSNRSEEVEAATMLGSVRPSMNSLRIGVGLQDVEMIVDSILGSPGNSNCSMAGAS